MAKKPRDNTHLYSFDNTLRENHSLICGVDEAGRGPLCGPLAVAAIILPPDWQADTLDDSKRMREAVREQLYEELCSVALAYSVVMIPPHEIDRINILNATLEGMRRAVHQLALQPNLVLIDGNAAPNINTPCQTVVKGDSTSASIAAASVLAKVTRDRYMKQLDEQYPQYKLAQHKGYGTKLHYELLEEHGVQSFYRQTFLRSFYARQKP